MLRAASLLAVNGSSPCAVTPRTHPVTLEPVGRSEGDPACCPTGRWCRGRELNPHPPDFQSAALPAELPLHVPGLMYVIG